MGWISEVLCDRGGLKRVAANRSSDEKAASQDSAEEKRMHVELPVTKTVAKKDSDLSSSKAPQS